MSKRKLSEGNRQGAEAEIKEKKALVQRQDPPVGWLWKDLFHHGRAKMGVDPFELNWTHYTDPVADASLELRRCTVIETNRINVWLLPDKLRNSAEFVKTWEPVASERLIHWMQEPLITHELAAYLPPRSQDKAPLAELVFSYLATRGVLYEELWRAVHSLFHGPLTTEQRELLQIPVGRLTDVFEYSAVVDFQIAPSYDGKSVVMWPIFELVHTKIR